MADQILFLLIVVGGLCRYDVFSCGFRICFNLQAQLHLTFLGAMVFFAVLAGFMQDFNVPFVLAFFKGVLMIGRRE